ncbi:MAG TPA: hypothetical protein VFF41_01255, partial [Gallionella sp.]|nr:hypothetical protein [Gallionella sp.]
AKPRQPRLPKHACEKYLASKFYSLALFKITTRVPALAIVPYNHRTTLSYSCEGNNRKKSKIEPA